MDKIAIIRDGLDQDFKIIVKKDEIKQDIYLLHIDTIIAKLQYVEGYLYYDMEITKGFNSLDSHLQQKALKAIMDIGEILKKEL